MTYTDETAINLGSLDNSDILVTGGVNGFSQLATQVGVVSNSGDRSVTVTYRIDAPGGAWDDSDNDTYTLTLQGNEVSDTVGNLNGASILGSFQVAIADTTAPTATAIANDIDSQSAGNTSYEFTLTYTDETAVDVTTFDGSDVLITDQNGSYQPVSLLGVVSNNDGSHLVTYSMAAPGGTWGTEKTMALTPLPSKTMQ